MLVFVRLQFLVVGLFGLIDTSLMAQELGTMLDSRDGKEYQTVSYKFKAQDSIISVTWLAENLNFELPGSSCFNNDPAQCIQKGRLYEWGVAMNACPADWSLPSDNDWNLLVDHFGGMEKAGRHLKAGKRTWPEGRGTNKSGFNGIATGTADPSGFHQPETGFFWSSTKGLVTDSEASDWSFAPWINAMRHWQGGLQIRNAVRCIKYEKP